MVVFEFRCAHGEPIEAFFPLGAAPDQIRCDDHNTVARRRFSAASFTAFPGSYKYDRMPRPHGARPGTGGR